MIHMNIIIKLFSDHAILGFHLGFSAKLIIWQVHACKMRPQISGSLDHPPIKPTVSVVVLYSESRVSLGCMECVFCKEGIWKLSGMCFGRSLEGVQKVSGQFLNSDLRSFKGVWRVIERCLEHILKVSKRCLKGVLKYHYIKLFLTQISPA